MELQGACWGRVGISMNFEGVPGLSEAGKFKVLGRFGAPNLQTADGKLQTADLICNAEDSKAENSRTANQLEAEDCRTIKMQRH